jgi:hypothetical protein
MYWLFTIVNQFRKGQVIPTTSSRPFQVEALCLKNELKTVLILANLTNDPQTVSVSINQPVFQWIIDEVSFSKANVSPDSFWGEIVQNLAPTSEGALQFELSPYATVFAEW